MEEKKVTWLELFYDLLFVAAVATTTQVLLRVEEGSIRPEYFVKFVLMFVPIWWAWTGQTLFINRFGQDFLHQRFSMIVQMLFVLIMTSSLSVDFDQYYVSFLIGYIGLRAITAIQYLVVESNEEGDRKKVARFLGTRFWIGLVVSCFSIFFDTWVRYAVLYAGIIVDIVVPFFGRKYLVKAPPNTPHLIERFASLTIILFGESVVSALSVLQPQKGDWYSIAFSMISFILVIAMWWQYFDNGETKINKTIRTSGQTIIYGHLFILMAMSMIAASIKLLYLHEVRYLLLVYFVFGSVLLYFIATWIVFHSYRYEHYRMRLSHATFFIGMLAAFLIMDVIVVVPHIVIAGQLALFFIVYAWVSGLNKHNRKEGMV
ncbi:MAG: low temperature requirement protein A [Clostridia bacterium]